MKFGCRPCFVVAVPYDSVLIIALWANQNRAAEVQCFLIGAVFRDNGMLQLRGIFCLKVHPKVLSTPGGPDFQNIIQNVSVLEPLVKVSGPSYFLILLKPSLIINFLLLLCILFIK